MLAPRQGASFQDLFFPVLSAESLKLKVKALKHSTQYLVSNF
jgi:hypothetical protein